MRLSEAYAVLGLDESASDDDVKKKARELMKTFHPDVCKDPDAEEKFKRVGEAVECIKSGGDVGPMSDVFSPFDGLGSMFDTFFGRSGRRPHPVREQVSDIHVVVGLTFEESVLGVNKVVSVKRSEPCRTCGGAGTVPDADSCAKCGGTGTLTSRQVRGPMTIESSVMCPSCNGHAVHKGCPKCKGSCKTDVCNEQRLQLPPRLHDGATLRVRGAGNVYLSGMASDVIVEVRVEGDPNGLALVGDEVSYGIELSLLEALLGKTVSIPLVSGVCKDVELSGRVRHSDRVEVLDTSTGVPTIVRVDVRYPDDLSTVIDALKRL